MALPDDADDDPCARCGHRRAVHGPDFAARPGRGPCTADPCTCGAFRSEPVQLRELPPARLRSVAAYMRDRYPPDGAYPVELFMSREVAAKIGDLLDELADLREERMRT